MPESNQPDRPARPAPDRPSPGELATPEFIAALLIEGDDDLAAWAIGQALEERPRAEVFDTIIQPAMALVGSRWSSGDWSISQEHLASVSLRDVLSSLRPPDVSPMRTGPVAVLAAPEGEDHVAGLACLAQVLVEHGWRVENLGANVPADDLAAFVSSRQVDLVGISIGTARSVPALRRTLEALRSRDRVGRALPIIVGGNGTDRGQGEIGGADLVAVNLAEAEAFIVHLRSRLPDAPAR